MPARFFLWQGFQVSVDPHPQVLRLEMDPSASWREMRVFENGKRRTKDGPGGIPYHEEEPFDSPLYPSVAALPSGGSFISAGVLAQKAKAVDDGIVAALELLIDDGTFRLPGRSAFLEGLQGRLRGEWERSPDDRPRAEAIGLVSAARSLAGDESSDKLEDLPTPLRLRRGKFLREFHRMRDGNVPLGVYSWDARLTGLYRQGKALQEPLPAEIASVLAEVLGSDMALRGTYEQHIELLRLTNPLVRPGLIPNAHPAGEPDQKPAIFPASDSPEGRLLKRLVGRRPVPPGFDLIGELIDRVGGGSLSLGITAESGWYDHVLHSLEPLLVPDQCPESSKLRLGADYRDDLRQLFRSLLGAARESHVKQLESMVGAGCPLTVVPHLTFEPLAEHYRRRAASYRFVRERLTVLLGEDVLLSRRRLTPRGESGISLFDELVGMESIFVGASAIVLDELGITPEVAEEPQWLLAAKSAARGWASSHLNDPDLCEDARMMVPLFRDDNRDEFHCLAIVGFELRNLKVSFVERSEVIVHDGRGREVGHEVYWCGAKYPLARPVTITFRTKRLLDRNRFRALCDREVTVPAILAALQG